MVILGPTFALIYRGAKGADYARSASPRMVTFELGFCCRHGAISELSLPDLPDPYSDAQSSSRLQTQIILRRQTLHNGKSLLSGVSAISWLQHYVINTGTVAPVPRVPQVGMRFAKDTRRRWCPKGTGWIEDSRHL